MVGELYEIHKRILTTPYIQEETASLYKRYEKLGREDIEYIIDLMISDNTLKLKDKRYIILYLALFSHNYDKYLPKKVYDYLLENNTYYPSEMFLRANSEIAKELIGRITTDNNTNHILAAISQIKCDETIEFFRKYIDGYTPKWAEDLYIPITKYTECGNWTFDKNGNFVNLISDKVISFTRVEKGQGSKLAPLKSADDKCKICGQSLTVVFNNDKPLATCLYCSCYQNIFTKIEDNKVKWLEENIIDDIVEEEEKIEFDYELIVNEESRKEIYTANEFAIISRSSIGGSPTAISDIYYPECPICGDVMKFVAQLDCEDVQEYGEGIYYFFTCNKCNIIGSNYSQS